MNTAHVATLPMSEEDEAVLRKLQNKAWFSFFRLYGLFFLFLVYIGARIQPGDALQGHYVFDGKMTQAGYALVHVIFAALFGVVALIFAVKDYRRLIAPLRREMRQGSKYCFSFAARKYVDPLYDKFLVFYPGKDELYIAVNKDDFESISDGEELKLEVAAVTGEVLALRSAHRDFYQPEEFSFKDK